MTRVLRALDVSDVIDRPSLISSEPLRISLAGDPSLRRMWPLLLADLSGRPPWADVARRCIAAGDFATATKLVRFLDTTEQALVAASLEAAWRYAREDLDRQVAQYSEEVQRIIRLGLDAKSSEEWLDLARVELGRVPPPSGSAVLPALADVDERILSEISGYLRETAAAIEAARREFDRKREETRREARGLRDEINDQVDDLLDAADEPLRGLLRGAARLALAEYERRDAEGLKGLRNATRALAVGDRQPLVALLEASSLARRDDARPAFEASIAAGPVVVAPTRRLSSLAEARLTSHKSAPVPSVEPAGLIHDVLESWSIASLKPVVGRAGGVYMRREDGWETALCAALLADAKSLLLEGELPEAQVLFVEAFSSCVAWGGRVPEAERVRDAAAWGVLVTLVAPHLAATERPRVLEPVNLSMLFYRRVGDVPLKQVDELDLFGALGWLLASMEASSAERFCRDYLIEYLRDRPIATTDLTSGLFYAPQESPLSALSVLAMLLRDVELLSDAADRVGLVASDLASASALRVEDRWWEAMERLRRKTAGLADDNEALVRLKVLLGQYQQEDRTRGATTRLSARLMTPEAQGAAEPYLVVEVHNQSPMQPLRHVRVDAAIVDSSEQSLKARVDGTVPLIKPGARAEMVLWVPGESAWPDTPRLRLRFTSTTIQGTRSYEEASRETFALRRRHAEPQPRVSPPNPYIVGGAVKHASNIVGRKDEIDKIIRSLVGEKQDNVVVVLGERRMGKTTVLNAVEQHPVIKDRYGGRVVRIDVQDVPVAESAETFLLHRLVKPCERELSSKGIRVPIVREEAFHNNPYETFKRFMLDLDASLGKQRVLIVIDELEKLLSIIDQQRDQATPSLGSEVMASLRAVMMQAKNLSFILAGVTDVLRRHTTRHASRLFRLGIEVEIKALPKDAADSLVEDPSKTVYEIQPTARDLVVGLTGRQPYLVQYIGHYLFEYMLRASANVATRTDVERVIERDILPSARLFEHFVEAVPDPVDADIVQTLGALQRGDETVPVTAIGRHLTRAKTPVAEEEITSRLLRLRERTPSVVDDTAKFTRRFRLTVGLYARRLGLLQRAPHNLIVRAV